MCPEQSRAARAISASLALPEPVSDNCVRLTAFNKGSTERWYPSHELRVPERALKPCQQSRARDPRFCSKFAGSRCWHVECFGSTTRGVLFEAGSMEDRNDD